MRTLMLLTISMALFTAQAMGAEHSELKAFPPAEAGMERFIIVLPEKDRNEETNFKVELIPGKVMLTDGVNLMRHGSQIEARPLAGWGYTYYEVTGQDLAMSTMMAAPGGSQATETFVSGEPLLIRYNSRLPIVIYAPAGYEIRYRLWSTTATSEAAQKDEG